MKATDFPPAGRIWLSWRWLWHVANGGRVGTLCTSDRCGPCRVWQTYDRMRIRRYGPQDLGVGSKHR